jgi:hypothetical protein
MLVEEVDQGPLAIVLEDAQLGAALLGMSAQAHVQSG